MNINYKQPQFELFPGNAASLSDINKPRFLLANLTMSIENLVILVILGIMLTVFAFSLGVERGKKIAGLEWGQNTAVRERDATVVPKVVAGKTQLIQPLAKATMGLAPSSAKNNVVSFNVVAVSNAAVHPIVPTGVTASTPLVSTAASPQTKPFTIQVASYKDVKYAQKEADVLKRKGFATVILPKGTYSIVCVGKFATSDEANSFTRRLKSYYKDCLVRRL